MKTVSTPATTISDPLTELLRVSAKELIAEAVELDLRTMLEAYDLCRELTESMEIDVDRPIVKKYHGPINIGSCLGTPKNTQLQLPIKPNLLTLRTSLVS